MLPETETIQTNIITLEDDFLGVFFSVGIVGYFYLFSILLLTIYLIYLSIIDIKKHEIEYWQTGLLYILSIANLVFYAVSENKFLGSLNAVTPNLFQYFFVHFAGFIVIFLFVLLLAMLKKNSIGGADIWAVAALSLNLGIYYCSYMLLVMCVAYLLFALFMKIIKKTKVTHVAFLPFISIGYLSVVAFQIF